MPTLRVNGNPAAHLRRIALHIRGCPKYVRQDAARRAKARLLARLSLQFRFGEDPTGKRWPLPKDGHRPAMKRTGRLERGYLIQIVATAGGLSLAFSNRMDYSLHLQRGTARMEARKQVPDAATGMPDEWDEDLLVSYQEATDAWYAKLDGVTRG